MNILFVSALLPYPLYSGGQVRIYNLLKSLSNKHKITLFSFIRDEVEKKFIKNLSFCEKIEVVYRGHAWQSKYVLASVFGKYPLLLSSYTNNEMRKKIDDELRNGKYDLVHIEPGYVYPSLPEIQLPMVVAEHNIESTIYEGYVRNFPFTPLRPFLYTDVLKLKYWERQIWRRAQGIVAVSEDDAAVMAPETNGQKQAVVPNGVDERAFPFKPRTKIGSNRIFLFVGNFSWLQNRDALKYLLAELWPAIQRAYPESRLQIVGKQMPAGLRNLAEKNEAVIVENIDDINAEYQKSDIMLAPIRIGGGTKFKILEAMASGLPIITTTKGIQGLEISGGQEIMLAENASETVKAISELLKSDKRKKVVTAARSKIDKDYTWQQIAKKLDALWTEVAQSYE